MRVILLGGRRQQQSSGLALNERRESRRHGCNEPRTAIARRSNSVPATAAAAEFVPAFVKASQQGGRANMALC